MKNKLIIIFIIVILTIGSYSALGSNQQLKNNIKNDFENNKNNYALGLIYEDPENIAAKYDTIEILGNAPTQWDWRDVNGEDWTTPIRDQGRCGSCYAFGALAAMETIYNINKNNPDIDIDLSEQYIVSCGPKKYPIHIDGCCGATITGTLAYIEKFGTVDENRFTYQAIDAKGRDAGDCGWQGSHDPVECPGLDGPFYKTSKASFLFSIDEMKDAIYNYGPIVATMKVYEDFREYTGGIYKSDYNGYLGGHLVAIVGYNDNPGYWICKNSWGTEWGEDGWFRIAYDECYIDDPYASACFKTCSRPRAINSFFGFFGNNIFEKFPLIQQLFNLLK